VRATSRLAVTLMLLVTTRGAHAAIQPVPSFTEYQRLLDDFVSVTSARGAPLETRVDYARMRNLANDDGGLDRGIRDRLNVVRRELLAIGPAGMRPATRLAWAINTYNFLVLESVADHALDWRNPKPPSSVQKLASPEGDFFTAPAVTIDGHSYSLNAFERAFVFPGRGQVKPAAWALDPRAHFALVCGAKGCPPLQPRAFLPESLDVQLDRATRDALASPRHLSWDARTHALAASEVFEWYAADFGGADGALAFIRKYAPASVRSVLLHGEAKRIERFTPWDWDLNQTPN
jgi:Protein of unknown function, DUF547